MLLIILSYHCSVFSLQYKVRQLLSWFGVNGIEHLLFEKEANVYEVLALSSSSYISVLIIQSKIYIPHLECALDWKSHLHRHLHLLAGTPRPLACLLTLCRPSRVSRLRSPDCRRLSSSDCCWWTPLLTRVRPQRPVDFLKYGAVSVSAVEKDHLEFFFLVRECVTVCEH